MSTSHWIGLMLRISR